jgi:predicted TIM-barrel fold metal-dependent hydrolase
MTMHVPKITRRAALAGAGAVAAGAFDTALGAPKPGRHPAANESWSPELLQRARDYFIVDSVVHFSNLLPNNRRAKRDWEASTDWSYKFHEQTTPARYRMTKQQYSRGWQVDESMDVCLLESPTDLVVYHSTPLYYAYWDGLHSNEKGAYLKGRYPDRSLWYAAIDMFDPLPVIKAKIDEVIAQGADGLKFYPTRMDPETAAKSAWFMDDPKKSIPVFEYARDKGCRHIAIHKLLEYTGPETPALGIADMYKVTAALPDVTFDLVHAGWLLLEETVALMRKRENVVATLEGPMMWLLYDMPAFHTMMDRFMTKVDIERVLFSTAAVRQHPYWQIAGWLDYQPPDGAAFKVTNKMRRQVFGENAARIYGIDIAARRRLIANDRFSRTLREHGLREPYSVQRAET